MAVSKIRRQITEVVRKQKPATRGLARLFKSPDEYVLKVKTVYFDIITNKEEYAVDVTRSTGGRIKKFNKFTTKEYDPLAYDEFVNITAEELDKRLPGFSPDDTSEEMGTQLSILMLDRLDGLRNLIARAIEIQARDVLFVGKITMANGDVIDFHAKASHFYPVPTAWTSSSANPLTDIQIAGNRARQDGKGTITDALFGGDILQTFLSNPFVKGSADIRRYDRAEIVSPLADDEGMNYHGTFSAGDYKLNIWSYPQFVDIPVGFGLPNEGMSVPYIPVNDVCVYSQGADLRLYYGGIPMITKEVSPTYTSLTGLMGAPAIMRGRLLPYFSLDPELVGIKVGMKSCPIALPGNTDNIVVIQQP